MKNTDDLQRLVGEWSVETFDQKRDATKVFGLGSAMHLIQEAEELAIAIRNNESVERIAEEAADCFSLLCGIAHRRGFSLHDALVEKFQVNKNRQWGDVDEKGVIHHVS